MKGALRRMEDIELLKKEIETLKEQIEQLKSDTELLHIAYQEKVDYEESQIRFRTIFETSKLGNKVISSDLKILQVNPAMVALLVCRNNQKTSWGNRCR
ncbi:MAG: hypothetical protein JWQ28_3201 [Pedobacter sp.]|jgi:PAS domain-containing protein|nr:hypothetical protein [Pedobacter sp.]